MMNAPAHLELPFFESPHRDLASRLLTWTERNRHLLEADEHDVENATRHITSALGEAGWLQYLLPEKWGGARPALDVRSLCLIRETLATYSGIADCAMAIQGLGSVPIACGAMICGLSVMAKPGVPASITKAATPFASPVCPVCANTT